MRDRESGRAARSRQSNQTRRSSVQGVANTLSCFFGSTNRCAVDGQTMIDVKAQTRISMAA